MHDNYRSSSPDRGRQRGDDDARGVGTSQEQNEPSDGYNRSRQDSSRSPSRYDAQGRRFKEEMGQERDDGRFDGDYQHAARLQQWDNHDYSGMYDEEDGSREDLGARAYTGDRHHGNHRHNGRDGSRTGSDSRGYRGNSRSRSPTREAGRPSDTVILENLPSRISPKELEDALLRDSIAVELQQPLDVRIPPSKGKRRAFVQFQSIDDAMIFIREHYPRLNLPNHEPTDANPDDYFSVYVHYAHSRDDMESRSTTGGNWKCPDCNSSNYASRFECRNCNAPQSASNWRDSVTGATDAVDSPSQAQILVVYPLPSFVDEDMLASEMKRLELEKPNPVRPTESGGPKLKSTAPVGLAKGYGGRPGSLRRVFLMREMNTGASFNYGFVEFWTLEDANAALMRVKMSRAFTISSCEVKVSNIHMGVFIAEDRPMSPDTEKSTFFPLFNPSLRVRYRDIRLYPSQRIVAPEHPNASAEGTVADQKKSSKKRKADGALGASTTKKAPLMAGQMARWQQKHDEIHTRAEAAAGPSLSDANQVPVGAFKSNANAPIKIVLGTTKLGSSASTTNQPAQTNSPEKSGGVPASEPNLVSYVDRAELKCLLCMRKFKSLEMASLHEAKSQVHKSALENEELVKAALPRLAGRDKQAKEAAEATQVSDDEPASATSKYLDRAKLRRETHDQPSRPVVAAKQADGQKLPAPVQAPPPPKPQQGKGAGLLAKMGWDAGKGLGAKGEGRTEIIMTNAYQERAGLGVEGGNLGDAQKLAEEKTKDDRADYLRTVQDKARERYNKMG